MTTVRWPLTWPMPVTMPSAGVFWIRSSSRAAAALGGHGQRAVFDEGAGVAQVGDVLARGAQAQGVALGHGFGAAGVVGEGLALPQALQVGTLAPFCAEASAGSKTAFSGVL